MSTSLQFVPNTSGPFQFKPTIDGTLYTAQITYSLFGQRYYLNLYDQSNDLVLCRSLVSSGPQVSVTLTWEDLGVSGGLATIETSGNHNVPVGQLVNVYVSQTGTAFDGLWQALAVSATELTYGLNNPEYTQPLSGQMRIPVNLVATLGGGWLIWDYATGLLEWA